MKSEEQTATVGSCGQRAQHMPTPNPIFEVLEFAPVVVRKVTTGLLLQTCPICFLCTLIETSGAKGRAFGSTNGRAEGSVPFWTSFPKRDPCSRNFLVSSRVSTPVKTAQPQMMVLNSVISEGRCPGTLLTLSPESNTTVLRVSKFWITLMR